MRHLLLLAAALSIGTASAQTLGRSPEAIAFRNMAERNHLGLLEYCRGQGFIGEEALVLQRRLVAALPPAPGPDTQAAGRQGDIAIEGSLGANLAASARAQGTTLRFACEQEALRVLRQEGG